MAIIDSLNSLESNIKTAKQTLVTNLNSKGVTITTANTLTEMATSVTGITAGGGGASGDVDFAALGINVPVGQEQKYQDGYKYAIEIKDTWDASKTDLNFKYNGDKKLVFFPMVDTSNVTNMDRMFYGCSSLTTIGDINAPACTTMTSMFDSCTNLTTIGNIDAPLCTDMSSFIRLCDNLTSIGDINLPSLTGEFNMFYYAESLKSVGKITVGTCSSFSFYGNKWFTTLPIKDFSKVQILNSAFQNTNLEYVDNIDAPVCTSMESIFNSCPNLTTVGNINAPACTNADYIFTYDSNLKKIGDINLPKYTVLSYHELFHGCTNLVEVGNINIPKIERASIFSGCTNLECVKSIDLASLSDFFGAFFGYRNEAPKLKYMLMKNLGKVQDISDAPNFSSIPNWGVNSEEYPHALDSMKDSLIKYSFDRASAGYSPLSIGLSSQTKALLSEDEKAQITAKGFTIA